MKNPFTYGLGTIIHGDTAMRTLSPMAKTLTACCLLYWRIDRSFA